MPLWSHVLLAPCVLLGPLDIDEATEVAKAMCNADMNSMLFTMHPQPNGATEKSVIIRNKRQLEDKLMGPLGFVICAL